MTHTIIKAIALSLVINLSSHATAAVTDSSKPDIKSVQKFELRKELMAQYPNVLNVLTSNANAGFGGEQSVAIANHMYSRTNAEAIADARAKLTVEPHGKGTWLLRFPYVNIAVFETTEGLVLVDAGYAPAGPALLETLRKLSNKRVNTIIITHHHADHGFGAWSLLEAGEKPRIITTKEYLAEMELDTRTANYSMVHLNSQDPRDVPRKLQEAILPTETFVGQKTLKIGDDEFVLTHARGESADQLWVNVPTRKVVISADYWQPFLLNAGNGKRRQRHVAEWAQALRDMAAAKPNLLLPMHGPALTSAAEARDKLLASADMLDSAVNQVIEGLNANYRPDEIVASVKLPEKLQSRKEMAETYVRFKNVASMVLKEYGGWWNGIPSEWDPASRETFSKQIVAMSGGLDRVNQQIRQLSNTDSALACQLADIAYFAAPRNTEVLQTALDAYAKRVTPGMPTQELTVYIQHMLNLKSQLKTVTQQ